MEGILNQLQIVLKAIKDAQNAAGRSEKGRLLAIAATDVEKATWALREAAEVEAFEERNKDAL